jgi:hypothetical protein
MRRKEIQEVTMRAIEDNFPDDVAERFNEDSLEGVARYFQGIDMEDRKAIDAEICRVRENTPGKTLDWIADGDCNEPAAWLYSQLR